MFIVRNLQITLVVLEPSEPFVVVDLEICPEDLLRGLVNTIQKECRGIRYVSYEPVLSIDYLIFRCRINENDLKCSRIKDEMVHMYFT